MSILLERGRTINRRREVWLCDSEEDIQDLPISIPPGSFVLIPTDDGLIIKTKNNKGEWKGKGKKMDALTLATLISYIN